MERNNTVDRVKRSERDEPVTLSPWIPVMEPVTAAVLGKLQEELGELIAIVARCQIQRPEGTEPETGEPNLLKLEKEIADVMATMELAITHFGLNDGAIARRRMHKIEHLTRWHALLARL